MLWNVFKPSKAIRQINRSAVRLIADCGHVRGFVSCDVFRWTLLFWATNLPRVQHLEPAKRFMNFCRYMHKQPHRPAARRIQIPGGVRAFKWLNSEQVFQLRQDCPLSNVAGDEFPARNLIWSTSTGDLLSWPLGKCAKEVPQPILDSWLQLQNISFDCHHQIRILAPGQVIQVRNCNDCYVEKCVVFRAFYGSA